MVDVTYAKFVPEIHSLDNIRLFVEAYSEGLVTTFRRYDFLRLFSGKRLYFAYTPAGKIVAIAGFVSDPCATRADHVFVVVHPEFRGRGVAVDFLEWMIENLRDKGYEIMTAEVRKTNSASRKMMERAGFAVKEELRTVFIYEYVL